MDQFNCPSKETRWLDVKKPDDPKDLNKAIKRNRWYSRTTDEIGGRDVNSIREKDLLKHQSLTNILNVRICIRICMAILDLNPLEANRCIKRLRN